MSTVKLSLMGMRMMEMSFVAQGDLAENMGSVLGILNLIGIALAFGGLLFAAVMFMMGQTERVIYGLVGAVIGGLAFVIVKTMFDTGSGEDMDLELSTDF